MKGAWPPSSNERRFTVSEAARIRIFPTSVEPVKESLRTRPSSMIAEERSAGSIPVTTESTPFGSPAPSKAPASSSAESGASSEGLTTIAHPAARAAPTLRATEEAGKFQGVTAAVTPTGRLRRKTLLSGESAGIVSPRTRRASSAKRSRQDAAYRTSPSDCASGLPCSSVITRDMCAARSRTRRAVSARMPARSPAVVLPHPRWAHAAASMALCMSGAPPSGRVATVFPLAGFVTPKVPPDRAWRHSPPTNRA